MWKKLAISLTLVVTFALSAGAAGERTSEADIQALGTVGDVVMNASTWTPIPSTATVDKSRLGIHMASYGTNTANFIVKRTTSPLTAPSDNAGTTLQPGNIWQSSTSGFVYFWGKALSGGPTVYFEQLK